MALHEAITNSRGGGKAGGKGGRTVGLKIGEEERRHGRKAEKRRSRNKG